MVKRARDVTLRGQRQRQVVVCLRRLGGALDRSPRQGRRARHLSTPLLDGRQVDGGGQVIGSERERFFQNLGRHVQEAQVEEQGAQVGARNHVARIQLDRAHVLL